ncbi:pinopsin-like [Babylonia areolata]|uniref:pinopsin-like n=1 Tax=Babylonia areolata TaxID=304850 RepID=UPI003FD5B406
MLSQALRLEPRGRCTSSVMSPLLLQDSRGSKQTTMSPDVANVSTDSLPLTSPASADPAGGLGNPIGEVPRAMYYVVACMLSCAWMVGTFFNGMALVVYGKNKQLRTPTNSFVIALCVCDIFMCLLGMPVPIAYSWSRSYIHSHAVCTLYGGCIFFLSLSALYILAAISVDRYIVIVRPLASSMVTQRVASLAILVCFLMGFLWTVLPVLGWNHYTLEGIGVSCSVSWQPGTDAGDSSYIFSLFVFCFVLPLVTMTFCYANIYRAIRNIARSSPWGSNSHIAQNNYRLEKKMLKTVTVMIGAYLISWTPYTLVGLMETVTGKRVFGPVVETFPALIAKMSAVWDPIIYIATNLQFRRAFFELCPCCEVFIALCVSGDPTEQGSETVMDPESRAVLQNAEVPRLVNKVHASSDNPQNPPVPQQEAAVHHDSIKVKTMSASSFMRISMRMVELDLMRHTGGGSASLSLSLLLLLLSPELGNRRF